MNMIKKHKNIAIFAAIIVLFFTFLAIISVVQGSADYISEENLSVSIPFCIPFVGMLLSIAVFPLINGELWEKIKPYAVAFWSLLFLIPFAINYGGGTALEKLLDSIIGDYLTFIILLFGLFCISGNITLKGDLDGTPVVNCILLLISTALSSWIGTTGASMLMIRPIIRANRWRNRKIQIMVFFIFLVSNIGGCLTPVGDPPLLMGFTRGVPFFWSLRLAKVLIVNIAILLVAFFIMDSFFYKKDLRAGLKPNTGTKKEKLKIEGAHNVIFLLMVVGAVILSGVIPASIAIPIYKGVSLKLASIVEIVIILLASFLSFKTTKKQIRINNHFTWGAIQEVAVLFVGIFITMIPALIILKAKGGELGLNKPWQMFWVTGALSSFLDNTPTYLVFFTTAGSLGLSGKLVGTTTVTEIMLEAISCGAVFMGANTYIGNAPNMMVKSIAEENGIKMPSFFGYMLWSLIFLIPTFLIDTLIFFI